MNEEATLQKLISSVDRLTDEMKSFNNRWFYLIVVMVSALTGINIFT